MCTNRTNVYNEKMFNLNSVSITDRIPSIYFTMGFTGLQCFDAVVWVTGRASGL